MFLMRLKAAETGGEVVGAANSGEGLGAGDGVAHIVGAGGEDGVDDVIGKATDIFQIEVQALMEEGSNRLDVLFASPSHRHRSPDST